MPASDATAPTLRWRVENLSTGSDIDVTGSADVAASPGDTVRITLFADDPQGIQRIREEGGFVVECRSSSAPLAQNQYGVYAPLEQTLSPDSDNSVLTSILLVSTHDYITTCRPGFVFLKNTAMLKGTGENYFGGLTHAWLTVRVNP